MKVKLHIENFGDWNVHVPPDQEVHDFFHGDDDCNIHIFEDNKLAEHVNYKDKIKVAWIREIYDIYEYACIFQKNPYNPYDYFAKHKNDFDLLIAPIDYKYFSHLITEDRFMFCPGGCTRVLPEKWGLYEKNKCLSIVASSKDWTVGHRLRHWAINEIKNNIKNIQKNNPHFNMDVFGNGYNELIDSQGPFGKIYGLASYHYHFVIMNSTKDSWYTEALIDSFACGCIPIFFGCPNIGDHFNADGIIQFNSLPELSNIIPTLTPELYNSKIEAIKENMEIARNFKTDYDYLYKNHLETFKEIENS